VPTQPLQTRYTFCDQTYPLGGGNDKGGAARSASSATGNRTLSATALQITDFARLCVLSYESNRTFRGSLARWFPGWRLVYQRRADDALEIRNNDWTTFFELSDPDNTTTVFVVRGTLTALEILQDVNIWSPIAITQLAGFIGPDLTIPAASAVLMLSTTLYGEWFDKKYYTAFLAHVRERVAADPTRGYYLTGHSLGGGLAKLVALELGILTVTFSSPGLSATSSYLAANISVAGSAEEILHHLSFTVVPDNDVVPRVDKQLGMIAETDCRQGPAGCHSIGNTFCELLYSCGGGDGKVFDIPCSLCPAHRHRFPACDPGPNQAAATSLRSSPTTAKKQLYL